MPRFLACLLVVFAAALGAEEPRDYRLGSGDAIKITVFGESDLSLEARVDEGGRIPYPFLGQLEVAGKTPKELERSLADALAGDYLVDPRVSVAVVAYRPFFVNGQVRDPGSYAFQPGMTVRKAVSLAGGFTERASESRIVLIAEGQRDRERGRRVSLDEAIGPGDILTVEESFF
jgi:polysaccharide export outer membrane protein